MSNHSSPQDELSSLLQLSVSRQLFENRVIVLSEGIDSSVARRVIGELLALDAADPEKDITIFLNSPGGEVSSGFGIYDVIRFIRPKVKIVVTGLCASIATVILLAADKKYRIALPNSRLLIHQPLIGGYVQGQASDLEITAREIIKTREKLAEIYHAETSQPLERIQRDIERDYWMTTEEAKQYGLITHIVNRWSEVKEL